MRKSLILMLIATLLVGAFLVSCNSDISSESSNGDKLVKVTIAGNAKGISAVSTSDDADNYYWYYSATKVDSSVYSTGQTAWKAVKDGTGLSGAELGYFSSGAWKFSFYGYTTAQNEKPTDPKSSSVYYQEDNAVSVVKTTDTPTYVSVTLKEGSLGDTATLVINSMNWKYTPESSTAYSATLANLGENKTATIHFSYLSGTDAYTVITTATGYVRLYTSADDITTNASDAAYAKADFSFTGNYTIPASIDGKENTIKFWVTIGDETVGDEDKINVVAYSGGVVTLSIDSTGVAVADNEAFNKVIIDENTIGFTAKRSVAVSENKSAAKTIVTKAAPSTESNALTSITFPQGALVTTTTTEENTTYDVEMGVVVYQTESAASQPKFKITSESNPSTFAGLDLSVDLITKVNNVVSGDPQRLTTFNNEAVTVTTYIAKNLTGVQVVYTGNGSDSSQPSDVSYDRVTGALTFKTTHFSEFAVGANEKVYDKTTNTGYTVESFNALATTDIANHEFILLDATVANDIDDSRDVFNAGYKWTAIHKASEATPSSDFAGGYGTKIEPYVITSRSEFLNIHNHYSSYNYYVVDNASLPTMDASNWPLNEGNRTKLDLNGSIDGKGLYVTGLDSHLIRRVGVGNSTDKYIIKNFDITANINLSSDAYSYAAALIREAGQYLTIENVSVHGTITSNVGAAAFVDFGPGNITDTGDQVMQWTFKNCYSNAVVTAASDYAVGFIKHPYSKASQSGNSQSNQEACLLTIEDSIFDGVLSATSVNKAFYFIGNANTMRVKTVYSESFLSQYPTVNSYYAQPTTVAPDGYFYTGNYPTALGNTSWANSEKNYAANSSDVYLKEGGNASLSHIYHVHNLTSADKYNVISIQKVNDATHATASLCVAPGPGAFLNSFMEETLTETDGYYKTNDIKYFDITVNGTGTEGVSSDGKTFNIVGSSYNNEYDGKPYILVVQTKTDSDGVHYLSIDKFVFE